MSVKPTSVLKESVARIKEARTLKNDEGGEATAMRASVLKSLTGVLEKGGGGKRLTDLEEWQIYHVERCLEERGNSRSLPNLMGVKGKFKLSTRAPPTMLGN